MLGLMHSSMVEMADQVHKMTPSHSHSVADKAYNKTLAREHLLQWPSRKQLETDTVRLLSLQCDITRLRSQWLGPIKLLEDPRFAEQTKQITTIFDGSKESLKLIGILNVLLDTKGIKQYNDATELETTYGENMPAPLLKDIKQIIAAGPPAEKEKS